MRASRDGWRGWLDTAATLLTIAAATTLIYVAVYRTEPGVALPAPTESLPREPVLLDGTATLGNPEAEVAMIVYSDFECPFCGQFARETWPRLKEEYVESGRVIVAFNHFPLHAIHPHALSAAAAAECAETISGRFWDMHDLLFGDQAALDRAAIDRRATELGLDMDSFTDCMSGPGLQAAYQEGETATKLGIRSTPSFLIGRTQPDGRVAITDRLSGALPFTSIAAALDDTAQNGS